MIFVRFMKAQKRTLITILSSLSYKISITSNCWEGLSGNHYLFVITHYAHDKWTLQKKIIGFRKFEIPHTASNLS